MKKLTFFILALLTSMAFYAQGPLTGIKIYINPGHGGYDTQNDRSIWTVNVPETGNPAGYWESKSNLTKGLALRDMLEAEGATVKISRTENTSGVRDQAYHPGMNLTGGGDRDLTEIAEEANAFGADAFLSIHSNALNEATNYLLLLYRGTDGNSSNPASLPMVQKAGPIMYDNPLTVWSSSQALLRGDISFYPPADNGLGVLRPLTVPGFLSEGSFHDYAPETHRLSSNDYCKLEALRFFRLYHEYFNKSMSATSGTIAGFVKSGNEKVDIINPIISAKDPNTKYTFTYLAGTDDQWLPVNGATVKLMSADGAATLQTYTVDDWYNGVFAFYNVAPGNYKLSFSAANYETKVVDITAEGGKIVYQKMQLKNVRLSIADYPDPEQEAGISATNEYSFEQIGKQNPTWLQNSNIKRVLFRNNKYYVLTTDSKITTYDAQTNTLIKELDMTGISGGTTTISDIAFTADDYLLACNKDAIDLESPTTYFKVYTWDSDNDAPHLLFQSQKQANWATGIVGETFAVSGSRWNCKVYTTAVSSTSGGIRIVGLEYNEDTASPASKYMMDATNYTTALWGEHPVFTISPSGNGDHLYIDSELLPPTEYQFDWTKPDRDPLVKTAEFASEGYTLEVISRGANYFRYAQHTYMTVPVCEPDASKVGVVLFDVTGGLDKAEKVSVKYPEEGLDVTPAGYMTAMAFVTGSDINMMVMAENQGIASYRTIQVPTANIYASELSQTADGKFKFTLNEDARSVIITLEKEGEPAASVEVGPLSKGVHTIEHDFTADVDAGTYSWSVTAKTRSVGFPVKISDDSPQFLFYASRGVAVDNDPGSPYFGRVYISEGVGGTISEGAPNPTRTTTRGIYVLDAAFGDVTGQGATSYAGNVKWGTNNDADYGYAPFRLTVAPDGKVYVPASTKDNPGVWVMDPADPSANFTQVFTGTLDASTGTVTGTDGKVVHNQVQSCVVQGTGADTKLYTFNRTLVTVYGNINSYNVGDLSALPWKVAPSAIVYDDAANGRKEQNAFGTIASDARGGWWICQYRANSNDAVPALIHATNGTMDYNCGAAIGGQGSNRGAMAVSPDGSMLAIGTKPGEVEVYAVAYDGANKPTPTLKYTIVWGGGVNLMGAAFDAAGNLYLVSNGNERLMVYSLPKAENSFTTRARDVVDVQKTLQSKANVYASELSRTDNTFQFTLNDNAKSVVISLYKDGDMTKEPDATFNAGTLPKGVNTVTHDFSEELAESGMYSWTVTTTATTVNEIAKVSGTESVFQFAEPRGVAVDNTLTSPYFGRVYVSESLPTTGTGGFRSPDEGIYILNAALSDTTKQTVSGYKGGVTWATTSSPMRLAVAQDGKVYIADWSDSQSSGVWVMDPAVPSANFRSVFGGTNSAGTAKNSAGNIIHGSVSGCWVTGTGADTKLFTFDEDYLDAVATKGFNMLQYNIGESTTPWEQGASAIIYNNVANPNGSGTLLQQNGNSAIAPDGHGGWWISQYRAANSSAIPSLVHIGTDGSGVVNYNSGVDTAILPDSYQGGLAATEDGSRIAVGCSGKVRIFDVTYSGEVPALKLVYTVDTSDLGAYTYGISFDLAGNMYVVAGQAATAATAVVKTRLGVYALPKESNTFITPALSDYDIPVAVIVKPTVTATTPANGSTGVAANMSSVSVTFSAEMDKTTIGTVVITKGNDVVAELTDPQWSEDNMTVTLTLSEALENATQYTIQVSGFKDKDGVGMESDAKNKFTTKVLSTNANLVDLDVNGLTPMFDPDVTEYSVTLPCDENSIEINAIGPIDGTVSGTGIITLDKPGTVSTVVQSIAENGTVKKYIINVIRLFDMSFVVRPYWDNVLAVNLNPATNGGFTFTKFQWYKNGEPLSGSEGTRSQLYFTSSKMNGNYSIELTTADGMVMTACGVINMNIKDAVQQGLKVYPNPAKSSVTVENEKAASGDVINLFEMNGRFAKSYQGTGAKTTVDVSSLHPGYYVLRVGNQATTIVIEN
jgi:N-acetylmuramoyl-L-alanine amidase